MAVSDSVRMAAYRAAGGQGDLPVGFDVNGDAQTTNNSSSSNNSNVDPVANAQKLLDFQKQANQPVVQSLQTQTPGIQQKYTDLVASIKGNQQVSENRQTLATNNELGARGILPTSGYYQQEMANSLLPVTSAYSGQLANANAGSIQDLQSLALQIAQLQAGNPESAISGGLQISGLQNQSALLPSQIALQQAQAAAANTAARYPIIPGVGALDTSTNSLINQLNGAGGGGIQIINGVPYVNS